MAFFNSAVTVLQTLVIALGAGLGIWGAINLPSEPDTTESAADEIKKLQNEMEEI